MEESVISFRNEDNEKENLRSMHKKVTKFLRKTMSIKKDESFSKEIMPSILCEVNNYNPRFTRSRIFQMRKS